MHSNWKFFFGRIEYVAKAAPGKGIISSMVLLSDDLDEIDWEIGGTWDNTLETNYFGKAVVNYNVAKWVSVTSPQTQFHTYALDWSPTSLVWSIDGTIVRTLTPADAGNEYPQTPMMISLSLWDGGDPDGAKGTQDWAGGITPIPPPENYTMYIKSVKVQNANPGHQYQYTDRSGNWKSIKVINDTASSSSSSTHSSTSSSASTPSTVSSTRSSTLSSSSSASTPSTVSSIHSSTLSSSSISTPGTSSMASVSSSQASTLSLSSTVLSYGSTITSIPGSILNAFPTPSAILSQTSTANPSIHNVSPTSSLSSSFGTVSGSSLSTNHNSVSSPTSQINISNTSLSSLNGITANSSSSIGSNNITGSSFPTSLPNASVNSLQNTTPTSVISTTRKSNANLSSQATMSSSSISPAYNGTIGPNPVPSNTSNSSALSNTLGSLTTSVPQVTSNPSLGFSNGSSSVTSARNSTSVLGLSSSGINMNMNTAAVMPPTTASIMSTGLTASITTLLLTSTGSLIFSATLGTNNQPQSSTMPGLNSSVGENAQGNSSSSNMNLTGASNNVKSGSVALTNSSNVLLPSGATVVVSTANSTTMTAVLVPTTFSQYSTLKSTITTSTLDASSNPIKVVIGPSGVAVLAFNQSFNVSMNTTSPSGGVGSGVLSWLSKLWGSLFPKHPPSTHPHRDMATPEAKNVSLLLNSGEAKQIAQNMSLESMTGASSASNGSAASGSHPDVSDHTQDLAKAPNPLFSLGDSLMKDIQLSPFNLTNSNSSSPTLSALDSEAVVTGLSNKLSTGLHADTNPNLPQNIQDVVITEV